MINWTSSCDLGDDGQNMICQEIQTGFDYLANSADLSLIELEEININSFGILENLNYISFFLYISLVLAITYIILRWLFRLVADIVLGW